MATKSVQKKLSNLFHSAKKKQISITKLIGVDPKRGGFMKLYGSKANKPVPAITPSSKKEQAKLETLLKLQNAKRIIKHLEELDEEDLDYEYISDDSQDGTIQLDDLEELDANELEDLQADLEPVKKKRKKKTVHANSQPNVSQD